MGLSKSRETLIETQWQYSLLNHRLVFIILITFICVITDHYIKCKLLKSPNSYTVSSIKHFFTYIFFYRYIIFVISGYWRKQVDHITQHMKAHAQNDAEFRAKIGEPKMGKVMLICFFTIKCPLLKLF